MKSNSVIKQMNEENFLDQKHQDEKLLSLKKIIREFFDFLHASTKQDIDACARQQRNREELHRLINEKMIERWKLIGSISQLLNSLLNPETSFDEVINSIIKILNDYQKHHANFDGRKYQKVTPPAIFQKTIESLRKLAPLVAEIASPLASTEKKLPKRDDDEEVDGEIRIIQTTKEKKQQSSCILTLNHSQSPNSESSEPDSKIDESRDLLLTGTANTNFANTQRFVEKLDNYIVSRWNRAIKKVKDGETCPELMTPEKVSTLDPEKLPSVFIKNYDHWYSMFTGYDTRDKLSGALKIRKLLVEDLDDAQRQEIINSLTDNEFNAIGKSDLGKIFHEFKDEWPEELKKEEKKCVETFLRTEINTTMYIR